MNTSNEELHELADITKCAFSFVDSMVLKCAVELRIADIIRSHGKSITLSQIASSIDSPSVNLGNLKRVMRMLVRMKIFTTQKLDTETHKSSDDDLIYGLTPFSSLILHDADITLAPLVLMMNYPLLSAPWHHLSDVVKQGGTGFKKANGFELFEMTGKDPEFNKIFNNALRCTTKILIKGMFSNNGTVVFNGVNSVVDVGGGMGQFIGEIVKEFPNIKGVNMDLPHVVKMAPEIDGVTHVAGDMFKDIPNGDAITLKHILHDWGDEDCIKILKNCRDAITKEIGKVIIVEEILRENKKGDEGHFGNIDVIQDLTMLVHTVGGKERTEIEFKKILEEAGFSRFKIINFNYFPSLIEAYTK
ncbi:methyltransferase [Lithospermum erythrorhizon]|uniref:Methyltransferase n=1 Tax=Lithospermum erythrorhizon TaxID=34254 RepID=A0AAV3QSX4_LITER